MLKDKSLNVLDWLLEKENPGVRYLALRDLVKADGKELADAKKSAHENGPIAEVLSKMNKGGYWMEPGPGYNRKYFSTVWAVMLLAQLGASVEIDPRIANACSYLLENNMSKGRYFSINGNPSGTVDCIQGNLCYSLFDIGCTDLRLEKAYEWMARSVTGEGIAPITDKQAELHYYSTKCGPAFACGYNYQKSCGWGAAKVMLAFSRLPEEKRTSFVNKAIKTGAEFLFSTDPAKAEYPSAIKLSENWWKFGFPIFYITDILQLTESLVRLGYGKDPRLANALQLIRDKQDSQGRWLMEYDYTGKTWVDFGPKKQPNKWVTLRALRVLDIAEG
jgi:hypothetical protein